MWGAPHGDPTGGGSAFHNVHVCKYMCDNQIHVYKHFMYYKIKCDVIKYLNYI